jgi:Tfp pilus assembly protein PilF
MDKNAALTYCNRGAAWMNKGEFERARADFEASLKIAPDVPETLNAYAWFLCTCVDDAFRDGKRAQEMAQKAVTDSPDFQWYRVDTLAAAHAEIGEFDKAVELQTQVVEKAPADKQAVCRERLERFQNKQPIRSEFGKSATPSAQRPSSAP